jgi:DNA-directed RNA polymerase beta subunit
MLDQRFKNLDLFERRAAEWNSENVKNMIVELFKQIDVLPNWKFVKATWEKPKKKKREELKKHIVKILKVHINEFTQENTVKKVHVYPIQIPELIQNQFFYIGGLLKVPIFQIFDNPIIYKNYGNKTILRFKNNVISIRADTSKDNELNLNMFFNHMKLAKDIPIEYVIAALYKKEDFHNFVSNLSHVPPIINTIIQKCDDLWSKFKENKLIEKLGEFRISNIAATDDLKTGQSIIFAIKTATKVDYLSKAFMKTDCPILELLTAICDGERSDTNVYDKRVRFSEYVLLNLIKAVYDMICSLQNDKRIKFKITSTIIVDSCNVSSIIHHNFPYNPLGEVASLLNGTLIGPGSFKKENVPSYLKNLDESHYGVICPADTPDRDGCGVILNFCSNTQIDESGRVQSNDNDIICSYPITLVPFLVNDDQTRLQMASSQMKQSILLENATKPFVKTGCESNFFEYSSFKHIAKNDGEVIFKSDDFIIIKYNDDTVDIFKLSYRPMYLNSSDYLYSNLKVGGKFKKNDTIVNSKFFQDDELTLGNNLLTGVAIWNGYNYEDGIVISDDIVDDYTSIHHVELSFEIEGGQILLSLLDDKYKPLPDIGDKLKKGDVYARLKHIGHDGIESINIDSKNLHCPTDCEITHIEIFPSTWNKQIPQFDDFIKTLIKNQNKNIDDIRQQLLNYMKPDEINSIIDFYELSKLKVNLDSTNNKSASYSDRGRSIDSVRIILKGIYRSPICIGDKISNRHGAKGVIAQIVPKEEMPQLADGRHLEIIVNPLGIISRMNAGQLFELHSTEALHNLKQTLINYYNKNECLSERMTNKLYKFYDLFDVSENKWNRKHTIRKFNKRFKKNPIEAIEELQIIQPPFQSIHPKQLNEIMELTKSYYKQLLYNQDGKKCFKNEIAVGYMYFTKLIHRAQDKVISRSVGPYVNSTLQPVGGKKNHGGHRLGEMELWALIAQGAEVTIEELLTTHSDSPGKKLKVLSDILQNDEILLENDAPEKPRTLSLLDSMLKIIGLEMIDN